MHNFYIWFSTGFSHILDWGAYDHILFLFALCSIYTFDQWKKMLILITAFTLGHSLTLALSVLHVFTLNSSLVEFLIALTIIITCLYNLQVNSEEKERNTKGAFWMAACFGLIHGLGFASVLKDMLFDDHILFPLLSFNIGLEAGQLLMVILLVSIMHLLRTLLNLKQPALHFFISASIALVAFVVAVNRFTVIFHN